MGGTHRGMGGCRVLARGVGEEGDGECGLLILPSLAEGSRCGGASSGRASRVSGALGPQGAEGLTEPLPSLGAGLPSRSVGSQLAPSPPRCSHIPRPGAWTVS